MPQGCVGVRPCLYLLEEAMGTYVSHLQKGPPPLHLQMLSLAAYTSFLGQKEALAQVPQTVGMSRNISPLSQM